MTWKRKLCQTLLEIGSIFDYALRNVGMFARNEIRDTAFAGRSISIVRNG